MEWNQKVRPQNNLTRMLMKYLYYGMLSRTLKSYIELGVIHIKLNGNFARFHHYDQTSKSHIP